jgi:hypothetical protein
MRRTSLAGFCTLLAVVPFTYCVTSRPRSTETLVGRDTIELPLCDPAKEETLEITKAGMIVTSGSGITISAGETAELALSGALVRLETWGDAKAARVRWAQIGVTDLQPGDLVGRGPTADGAPGFVSGCPKIELDGRTVRLRRAAIEGLPLRAFIVGEVKADSVALELMGDAATTLERREHGKTQYFHHAKRGETFAIGLRSAGHADVLWLGGVPLALTVHAERGLVAAIDPTALARFHDDGGARMAAWQDEAGLDDEHPIAILAFGAAAKGTRLRAQRFEPQHEDELAALADDHDLCVRLRVSGPRVVPEMYVADPRVGCPDPFGRPTPSSARARATSPTWLVEVFERRRTDAILAGTNALLTSERIDRARLPFLFDWYPVRAPDGQIVPLPIAVQSLRARLATRWRIAEESAGGGAPKRPARRELLPPRVVARPSPGAHGPDALLAECDVHGRRVYTEVASGLGLMPLLGVRGIIDGLDAALPAGARDETTVLTIDPWLQRDVHQALRNQLASLDVYRDAMQVSAAALDPETGAVVGLWTYPDELHDPAVVAKLPPLEDGDVPRASHDLAGMRGRKVGSVLKLISGIVLAHRGLLDGPAGGASAHVPCERRRIVDHARSTSFLLDDGHPAELPIGEGAVTRLFEQGFAASCNGYFSLAGTVLIGAGPLPTWREGSTCATPPVGTWLVCPEEGERRVVLPAGTKLDVLAREGRDAVGAPGWFGRAERLGWRSAESPQSSSRPIWFADLPRARGRVFEYPEYQPIAESADQGPWLGFARETVGLAPQSRVSALAVAVLYSVLAREDGRVAAPRLLYDAPARAYQVIDPAHLGALARLRDAAAQVVKPGGTAGTVFAGRVPAGLRFGGKTGSFSLDVDEDDAVDGDHEDEGRDEHGGCAIASIRADGSLDASLGALSLGAACPGVVGVRVHLVPEGAPRFPPSNSAESKRKARHGGTSFVAVLERGRRRLVFAIIVDMAKPRASELTASLLPALDRWLTP